MKNSDIGKFVSDQCDMRLLSFWTGSQFWFSKNCFQLWLFWGWPGSSGMSLSFHWCRKLYFPSKK